MGKNSNVKVYKIVNKEEFEKGGFGTYNGLKLIRIEKVNSKKKVSVIWKEIEIETENELIHNESINNIGRELLKNA